MKLTDLIGYAVFTLWLLNAFFEGIAGMSVR